MVLSNDNAWWNEHVALQHRVTRLDWKYPVLTEYIESLVTSEGTYCILSDVLVIVTTQWHYF